MTATWGPFAVDALNDGGLWVLNGAASKLAAVSDGSDSSYLARAGTSSDEYLSTTQTFGKTFTGLPVGASIRRVGCRIRGEYAAPQTYLAVDPGQVGVWITPVPLPASIGWLLSGGVEPIWSAVLNEFATVPAGGSYAASVAFGMTAASGTGATALYEFEVTLETNQPPSAPTLTSPSGASSGLTPTMQGTYSDPDGDPMGYVEIEVRRVSDNASFWASGELSSGGPFSIAYAGTTLVSGTQYKWRARTRESISAGLMGAWSDFTNFTPSTNQIPVATLLSPIGNATVGTLTPTLQFGYSDADGDAQTGYQVQVRRYSDQVMFWESNQQAGAVTSVVYGSIGGSPTTLVGGTRYEWRARVQDSKGAWSNYSGWESFTPQAAPNPPTSITPSGLQNTLTPTVSGTYNQGTGAAEAAYQYEIRQGGVTIYQSGDVVATAIATGQAYGTNNPSDTPATPPALAWGTSYEIRARSKDASAVYSAWSSWQAFSTNAAPTTPTNLAPSGAVTGDTTPALSWTHNDPNSDAQTEAEVELRKVSDDSVVTGYGPKTLTQSTTTHDVTETLIASPATDYKWRIRTKGTSGPGFGPWSAWQTFTVATAPTFSVTVPTPSQVVAAPALVVGWTMTGGSGTQQSWRVRIYASDQTTLVHDSGVQSGTAVSYQLATGILSNSGTYYAQVTGEDTLSQAASSTKVLFTTDWTPPATITGLTAQSIGSQA